MAKVYYRKIDDFTKKKEISKAAGELLAKILKEEKIKLENKIALKVHFGEHGNETYITPDNFDGIIDVIEKHKTKAIFTETNAVYSGHRLFSKDHMALAKDHGFTRLPVVIADGDHGEDYAEITINKKQFRTCKIGKTIAEHEQLLIISHFKGHTLAGFGGAIKQLAMGCAARGGKLAMHANSKPVIIPFLCKKCNTCVKNCPVDAITIGAWSRIDHKKCIGCASCIAVCPHKAVLINFLKVNLAKKFYERLAEYAYAAQKDKKNIYISFAGNITKGCDCIGKKMKPFAKDAGVFVSTDPVAIDTACIDIIEKQEGKKVFKGKYTLDYAEKIGLGKKKYELVEM
ncbi:MAG: DUF362 domain-containing protein [Nanoarchaeota archaeon]|nr:DUF362 domain-containing protein [Nanoarchaeota archaeon]